MQFKLLAATLLASSVAAEYTNYMDCLVKKKCEDVKPCVNECFQTDKVKQVQYEKFDICVGERCLDEGSVTADAKDFTKFYECIPKCYNEHIGKPNDTQVDLNAKASDKKDEEKKEDGKEGENKEDSKKDGDKKEEEKKDDDKKEGDKKGEEKKDGDKKDDATNNTNTNTTTTKPPAPAPAPTNNAFKTIPSVFAALFLTALAL